ncbi:MAG: ribosome small subunit-dependent GTPase A [Velocimicrobium sp.]
MQGKIIKGIAGFYYVHTPKMGVYECKAKGIFRNRKQKPLVGDNVIFDILDENEKKGNIMEILARMNQLIRPAVSNIDQALVIFAVAKPEPNLNLLDRFLLMMNKQKIETIICFNKMDVASQQNSNLLLDTYEQGKYQVIFTSAAKQEGVEELRSLMKNKTTVLAGPSGVGKSSLINLLIPEANMETGEISQKIERGKHTTRHSELFCMEDAAYIMDTPGFSSLFIENIEKDELKNYFPEFIKYEEFCRFAGCLHLKEPDCAVKQALEKGELSKIRYDNYVLLYEELKNKKKYK